MPSCVVLGGAARVWADLEAARRIGGFDGVVAVNDAMAYYEGALDIAATLHPEKLSEWLGERQARGYPGPSLVATHKAGEHPASYVTDYRWPGMTASGSSGLFAVKVAIEQGYDRIILCGVPMQAEERHFFDARPWKEVESFTQAWQAALPRIREVTRSMSGLTRAWLGAPDAAWLNG